jgi:hypothetical protein
MDPDAIYVMDNRRYTYDELCDAIEAEAETLPPETWRDGEFNLNDYMIEATQVGIIETVDEDV